MKKAVIDNVVGPLAVLAVLGGIILVLWYTWSWSDLFMAPIHTGMTMAAVQSYLGEAPRVRKHADATESWDYRHWWSRDARIYFGTNGTVVGIDTD